MRVELICYLAQNGVFTNTTAEFILADLVEKVGDVKNGAACQEALSCIAEATSLEFVSSQVWDCSGDAILSRQPAINEVLYL